MVKLTDAEKVEIFNRVKEIGHPDPAGFVARIGVESRYDKEFSGDNPDRVGITQLSIRMAKKFGQVDWNTLAGNIVAAAFIDIFNYEISNKSIDKMFQAFRPMDKKYLVKIKREKQNIKDSLEGSIEKQAIVGRTYEELFEGVDSIEYDEYEAQIDTIITIMDQL